MEKRKKFLVRKLRLKIIISKIALIEAASFLARFLEIKRYSEKQENC
jgi:hypothetical protein